MAAAPARTAEPRHHADLAHRVQLGAAGRDGADAQHPLRLDRLLGPRGIAGRASRDQRPLPFPRASVVQRDRDAHGARHRRGVRCGRRGCQRLHGEGVHLLLRARARPRSGAGGRSSGRHVAALDHPGGGSQGREPGDPVRDRHARRLPGGRGSRSVHPDLVAGPPARPADPRDARTDPRGDARIRSRLLPPSLHPRPARGRGGRQRAPRGSGSDAHRADGCRSRALGPRPLHVAVA